MEKKIQRKYFQPTENWVKDDDDDTDKFIKVA